MKESNILPTLKLFDCEPLQDQFSDGNGNYWGIARLIDITEHLKPFDCPLASLDLSTIIWDDCNILELAMHIHRVNAADFSEPIIISWNGSVADGRHRIMKAIIMEKTTIKAVRMQHRPTPCCSTKSEGE